MGLVLLAPEAEFRAGLKVKRTPPAAGEGEGTVGEHVHVHDGAAGRDVERFAQPLCFATYVIRDTVLQHRQ